MCCALSSKTVCDLWSYRAGRGDLVFGIIIGKIRKCKHHKTTGYFLHKIYTMSLNCGEIYKGTSKNPSHPQRKKER